MSTGPPLGDLHFRVARPDDAHGVAELHADSWRHHYRGAYSDAFLDGDILADRVAVWTDRLRADDPHRCTILATDGDLVGFANTVLDADPTGGRCSTTSTSQAGASDRASARSC